MLSSLSRVTARRICIPCVIAPRQAWNIDRTTTRTYATSGPYAENVDEKAAVVYKGDITTFIKAVKVFSLTSSVMGMVAQPLLYKAVGVMPSVAVASVGVVVIFFTYVTPLMLHWITKKYVTEMRFEPRSRTFTATTLTFFLHQKRLQFQACDVRVPDVPGPFTTFLAKETPLFVDFRRFSDIDSFRHLMGYDKPIDFKLDEKPN